MNTIGQTPHCERTSAHEQSLPESVQMLSEHLDARMDAQEELLKLILAQTKALRVESHSEIDVDDKERMLLPAIDSGMFKNNISSSGSNRSGGSLSLDGLERQRRQDALRVSETARLEFPVESLEEGTQKRIQRRLQQIIGSTTFGVCTCMAIFANTLMVGFEVELSGKPCCQKGTTAASIFSNIQMGFTVLFFNETLLRIIAKGCRGYFLHNPEWNWDFFDLALVLTSVAEIVINNTSDADVTNLVLLRIIRIAQIVSRASRIMRLLKVARFFRPIRVIVRSLYFTIKSLIWIIVSLAMITYVFALVFTSTTNDHLALESNASKSGNAEQLKQKFGTIPRSMFSLYSAVSGGIDWEPLVFMLAEVHAFWGAMFVFFQFFIFFAVMNVITGVCCEGAIESAYKDASLTVEAHLANLDVHVGRFTDIFKEIDSDGSGSLTIGELEEHLGDPRIKAYFESMDIDAQDAWTLFSLLDTDKTNDVDAQEFVRGCLRLKGSAKAVDVVKLNFETRWMANKIHNLSREFRLFQNEFARVNRLLVAAFPKSHRKSGKQCIGL